MSVCHQWILKPHDVEDDARPGCLVVCLHFGSHLRLFVRLHGLVVWNATFWSNYTLHDKLRDKVRRIRVILFTERNDFPHWFLVPVGEVAANDRCLVESRDEVIISPVLFILLLVVIPDCGVLHFTYFTNAW